MENLTAWRGSSSSSSKDSDTRQSQAAMLGLCRRWRQKGEAAQVQARVQSKPDPLKPEPLRAAVQQPSAPPVHSQSESTDKKIASKTSAPQGQAQRPANDVPASGSKNNFEDVNGSHTPRSGPVRPTRATKNESQKNIAKEQKPSAVPVSATTSPPSRSYVDPPHNTQAPPNNLSAELYGSDSSNDPSRTKRPPQYAPPRVVTPPPEPDAPPRNPSKHTPTSMRPPNVPRLDANLANAGHGYSPPAPPRSISTSPPESDDPDQSPPWTAVRPALGSSEPETFKWVGEHSNAMRLQSLASARVEGAIVSGNMEGNGDARFSPRTLGLGRVDYSQGASPPVSRGKTSQRSSPPCYVCV